MSASESERRQSDVQPNEIGSRKAKHLEICTDPSGFTIEDAWIGFESVHLVHDALPELTLDDVDASEDFLGQRIALPLLISCMTGGSEGGFRANRDLAAAAEILRVPVGLGSVRVLFDHAEMFSHFHVKPLAPGVPVLANLGAQQIRDVPHAAIFELMKRLEVQSLVVHLNPGQELFQPEGDRDFRGLKRALARLCAGSPLPIIVKETGFGIHPDLVRELLDMGAAYVDLAGAGGTNWIAVESYRLAEEERTAAREFDGWGLPTAVLLASLGDAARTGRVIASGGLRTGMDLAKAVALGARLGGMALPLIRTVRDGGVEGTVRFVRRLERVLRSVLLLTGSRDLEQLRAAPRWLEPELTGYVEALRAAFTRGEAGPEDPTGTRGRTRAPRKT